ncbi:penicillin-binding protein 1C [Terrimonas pollutisoli]|uniref:penicillin-binding protein 1C n=1 Tax=Terrimonas pollutisoli TaxID=3034147 RepID=UPI0023ECFE73|nr:penicillin-binding protein 1C [Terrimonas sp. H1YJ31]
MKSRITSKKIFGLLKYSFIGLLLLFVVFLLLNLIFPLPDKIEYSTVITDNKGEVINVYLTADEKWRMKTELQEISPLLRKTIVAKEDKYFYSHPGVNPLAITRAFFKNLLRMKRTSGASTITMQVARALDPGKRNILNKIRESFRALQLEWKYDKNEILQLYLNLVPYGGNIEGVKAAAFLYFKKNPDHLSLAEITALSIIPNRPSSLVIGKNNDHVVAERNKWLQKFANEKVFTKKEIEDALAEPLTATRGTVPHYAPHLSYQLKQQGNILNKTTINLNTQLKTEKLVEDYVRAQRLRNIKNAAVVIIDNKSHKIISYVGSSDFTDTTDGGQVNGAKAIRQPGSTLKPLLYAMCFDEGLLTPKTVMTDVPVNYEGYAPENYDRKFNGYITTEYALEHSLNIPAVKSLKLLGHEKLIQKLSDCNFKQVQKDKPKLGLSMILGGCGTTLEELTGLFAAFANDGIYYVPSFLQDDSITRKTRVVSPAAVYMINEILSKVNRPDFPLNWTATERMPKIAWKTGTSYGRRDAWSIGYNKNYTVGVWVGNFSGVGVADLSGATIATPLLFKIFNTLDYDNDKEWFSQPKDCEIRQVCSETGLIPSSHCTNLITDYFIPLVSSTKECSNRQEIMISPGEEISYCKTCAPETGYKKKWYKSIEPEMQAWFEEHQISYLKIPLHNPDCELIFKGSAPMISSPANGVEYLINKKDPEPLQLVCKTANDVSKVYWYIDNKFYKSSNTGEKQFFVPNEGPVKISCTDDKGRNRDIKIIVKYVNL